MRTAGGPSRRCRWAAQATGRPPRSVEGVAAGAGPGGVRVVDREALLLDRVHEVDGGAAEVRGAHLVRDHRYPAELAHDVPVGLALVEVQLVAQARAAPGLHGNPQPQVIAALLLEEVADLGRCLGREVDALLRGRLVLNGHLSLLPRVDSRRVPGGPDVHCQRYAPGWHSRPCGRVSWPAGITALAESQAGRAPHREPPAQVGFDLQFAAQRAADLHLERAVP